MIYRVTIRTTASDQPRGCGASWATKVAYCGTSLTEARIAYLREEPMDYWRGYGNAARETLIERHEEAPEDLSSNEGEAASIDDDLVDEAHACPGCGERRVDELVFQDDDDSRVRCSTCTCVYDPASGKAVAR